MSEISKKEEEIKKFWVENRIYEKSRKKNSQGKKFYFMDGPPYATGSIHMGTALNKILKDIAMRSRRLQGFDVFDRPGYDTHGVPIEFQVEKEIGSTCKQDIEKFGVNKFVAKCRDYATKYIDVMNSEFKNLGVWMDWKNPYLTLSDSYIEAIWSAFKEADKKGLLYLGKYPVHICPRCETVVAFNEIEYGKQKDNSIFVKFPLKEKKDTYLIIWTTTPWTLPGNTGVMVNPNIDYQEIEVSRERWIIAKDLVGSLMKKLGREFSVKSTFKGKKMEGWKYENPLSKNLNVDVKNGYRVVLSKRYVTAEEGSGLVHSAPGHGKEDYEVGKKYGLDVISPVNTDGTLTSEAGKYAGKKARAVDTEIIEDLKRDEYLVHSMKYEHDYPLCWRDKTPLIMISQPQWFLKISSIQKKLLKENEKTNWIPKWAKLRMKAWLEGIGDWPISRQRYWGTPLPIWYDSESGEKVVVGSIEELENLSGEKNIGLHKPEIDKIDIVGKNGKRLKRVAEVLDVWFDSGVSSWAALEYPREKKKFKKFWPADLNLEGSDQIRGWWNSQFILSEITFGKKPFDSIMMHGLVLAIGKKKMSKSLGNAMSPKEVIDRYGRDYMRYYYGRLSKGDNIEFNERSFKDVGKIFMMLRNINRFVNQIQKGKKVTKAEDKWILSRYNSLVKETVKSYNSYRFPDVVSRLEEFLIEDLSRTYIKIVRGRSGEVYDLLNDIRIGLIKLFAPLTPFLSEMIWQDLKIKKIVREESVHLSELPKAKNGMIDSDLEKNFAGALRIIEAGLSERDKAKIGLRWPLKNVEIHTPEEIDSSLREIIERQLNVKSILIKRGKSVKVKLDAKMTPELKAEGFSREFARAVQAERKKEGLSKGEIIVLRVSVSARLKDMLKSHLLFLKERTNSKKIEFVEDKFGKKAKSFKIKDESVVIEFL